MNLKAFADSLSSDELSQLKEIIDGLPKPQKSLDQRFEDFCKKNLDASFDSFIEETLKAIENASLVGDYENGDRPVPRDAYERARKIVEDYEERPGKNFRTVFTSIDFDSIFEHKTHVSEKELRREAYVNIIESILRSMSYLEDDDGGTYYRYGNIMTIKVPEEEGGNFYKVVFFTDESTNDW